MSAPSIVAATLTLAQVLSAPHALATLGLPLSTTVTDAEVRAAYRAGALYWHPDKLSTTAKSDPAIVQSHGIAFIKINEAFQAVKESDARWTVRAASKRKRLIESGIFGI
jgi:hypothetical protein